MATFGQEFKRLRRAKKVTLREIGDWVGKSIGYLSDIEHDRKGPPDLRTVEKIEQFLGIRDNYLVNLAATLRKARPVNMGQRIRARPLLSELLLRADEMDDDELREWLSSMEEKGRKE